MKRLRHLLIRGITFLGLYETVAWMHLQFWALYYGISVEKVGLGGAAAVFSPEKFNLQFTKKKTKESIIISGEHFMYGMDILQLFDFHFNAVVSKNKNDLQVVNYSRPTWQTLKKSGVRLHFTSFPEFDQITDIYLEHAKLGPPNQVILDLGAYCGGSTYFFSTGAGASSKIIACEPDPANYESLLLNIKQHNLKNVIPLQYGIWEKAGSIDFQAESNQNSGISAVHNRKFGSAKIECKTLADLVAENNLDKIDFIKMDIEGAEVPVLRSSRKIFQQFRPRIIVEPHLIGGQSTMPDILNFFVTINYRYKLLSQDCLDAPLIYAYPS